MLLNRFRRITRDGRWIPEIDGLRFVAIASVFLFHLSGELAMRSGRIIPMEPRFAWLGRMIGNGDRGVILFFVISGMILALPFARHFLVASRPVSLRKYYLRRVTRLEPPYIASIALILILLDIWNHGMVPGQGGHVLASLFYQHSLIYGQISQINPVTWSLEVEIQFYVLAPLVMQVFRIPSKVLRRGLMLAAILAMGFAQMPFQYDPRFISSILFYLQYFIAGLLIADVFVLELDRIRSNFGWDAVGLGALVAIFWTGHDEPSAHVIMPFIIMLFFLAGLRSVALRKVLAAPWIAVIGGMCYSIYLLHFIFIAAIFKITRYAILQNVSFPLNLAIQLLVTGLPVILLCTVFFLVVERPCMDPDWPSKFWHFVTGRPEAEVEAFDVHGISE